MIHRSKSYFFWEDLKEWSLIILLVLIIIGVIFMVIRDTQTRYFCLENGYKEYDYLLLTNTGYCIREENEYEITIPVDEVLERSQ